MTIKIVILNEIICELKNIKPIVLSTLHKTFSYEKPGGLFRATAHLTKLQRRSVIQNIKKPTESLVDIKLGLTYNYLLPDICKVLDRLKMKYEIEMPDSFEDTPELEIPSFDNLLPGITLRDYQKECIETSLNERNGFIVAATSAGKTNICAGIANALFHNGIKTIIIVPSVDLVVQSHEQFKAIGIDCGVLYAKAKKKEEQLSKHILITTYQSLNNNREICLNYHAVIVDECHQMKAPTLKDIVLQYCNHMLYRYGMTGTFPKEELYAIQSKCAIGDIIYKVDAKYLIDAGYLSTLQIHPLNVKFETLENDVKYKFSDYQAERAYFVNNEDRNAALALVIDYIVKNMVNKNTLVLVPNVSQGQMIAEYLPNAVFISGETDNTERQEVYDLYKDNDDVLAIATYGIASTGISITRIYNLVMIDLGKSFTRVIQTIGRGLRKNAAENKFHVNVFDIMANSNVSLSQYKKRLTLYKEAGYPVDKLKTIEPNELTNLTFLKGKK